ncbi:MAG: hypothetical protein ACYDD4_12560 [Acidimicrobiales bacterium]
MFACATAGAYLEVAQEVLAEEDKHQEFLNVAAGLAVLVGIAASDALCCLGLRRRNRGDDHRAAAELLEQATTDGKANANIFRRLIDLKDAAHYGVMIVSRTKARQAIRWAEQLLDRAQREFER